ncbi:MAG: MFS transporter [Treponema sp.]|jgi:OFA family oxalate/formate antiporter-like MFS transporter|nr:MFS transporter [Treponema sp.]
MNVPLYRKQLLLLFSGTIILLFVGLIYAWSIIALPLEQEFSWTRDKTSLVFVAVMVFFTGGLILTGFISQYVSPKICLRISGLLIFAGFATASHVHTIAGMCFSYSLFCGLGIGITYNTVLSTTLLWFPERTGFASGFLLGGFGLSSFVFGPIVSFLLNSGFGWRRSFFALGIMYLVLILFESFLIEKPRKQADTGDAAEEEGGRNYLPSELLRSGLFRRFFLWGTLLGSCTLNITGIGALFASDMGAGAMLAAAALGFISIGSGCGRIGMGFFYDCFGRKYSMVLMISLLFAGILPLICVFFLHSYFLVFTGFFLTGLAGGSLPTIYSCVCKKYFGAKHFSYNIALFNSTNFPCVFLGNFVGGIIRTLTGSYLPVFVGMAGFCILAFFVQLWLERKLGFHI